MLRRPGNSTSNDALDVLTRENMNVEVTSNTPKLMQNKLKGGNGIAHFK